MSGVLLDYLTREHATVSEFVFLLDREAEAMTQGRFADLPGLAERKAGIAEQIALLGRLRDAELCRLGHAPDRSGTDAAATAGGKALQNAWQDLQKLAAKAHEHNHRNGVMIHAHLDFTRQAIGFLKASGKPLYGPDGTHNPGTGHGNSLALG